jgi:purine-binding chemotaxis protein CheW
MSNTYLSFTIFGELYAIQVERVLEVLEKQDFTRVPNAPPVIQGVLSFRGNIVPVYESRIKFNLPEREENSNYYIIIIDLSTENGSYQIGAIVDKVKDVVILDDSEIKPVPPMSKEFNAELIKGIGNIGEKFIMIIDVDKIFTSSEITRIRQSTEV